MKHKNSHLLVGYWSRIRKGRDVPDQTDIDPRAIKRMLPYVFILDVEDPSRPIYRKNPHQRIHPHELTAAKPENCPHPAFQSLFLR